jgi:hypothetical protein
VKERENSAVNLPGSFNQARELAQGDTDDDQSGRHFVFDPRRT